jgi:hypothetical protein
MQTLEKKSLFWDVDTLNQDKDGDFIITRILNFGDTDDFTWAINYYGEKKIAEVVRQSGQLNKRSFSFWCNFFNINPLACIKKQSANQQSAFSQR